jgi:MFS family permease
MASLFRHRDFRLLWAGESVSQFGSQVSLVAITLVAVRSLHASTFEVGVLDATSTVAFLLVGLPAGAWVDRLAKRPVMILSDLGRLVAYGSIPVAYGLGGLTLLQLYVVTFLAGILTVFFDVAYQSYLPDLIGHEALVEGNSKLEVTSQLAGVGGPSLAGVLVQVIGGPLAVAVDAASFGVSAVAVAGIRAPEGPRAVRTHPHLRSEIAEGLRFVFGHPILRAVAFTTATSNLFSSMYFAVAIVFLVRIIHLSPGIIGLVLSFAGVGGVLGGLGAAAVARRIGSARATILGIVFTAGILVVPGATPSNGAFLFAAGSFFAGFGSVLYNVNQVSFRQRLCPPALLGRMNASMRFVVSGVMPLGALAGGAVGSAFGVRWALWIGPAGSSLAVGWLLASPIARMRDFPDS